MALEKLGPYKLEKILGRGGMGAVYVGVDQNTGQRAAVKVLNPMLSEEEGFRERFKGEVETLKRLLHPNIVQLFGFGEDDGHLFYAMEMIQGRSLQDELAAGRRFTWRDVTRIGIEVAKALKHAHDRGIIHRDLKPANLLIDLQEHIKLTDFGIAKLYGGTSMTSDGGVLGTADYMAPEQAEGKQISTRCDLYSLGSVLHALIAGRPPFAAKSLPEVLHGLRYEKPIPLRRLSPDIPEEFENIVLHLLEKDPQKRIPTAVAVANRLKAMEHALSMETQIGLPPSVSGNINQRPTDVAPPVPGGVPDGLLGTSAGISPPGMSSRPTVEMGDASRTNPVVVSDLMPTIITSPQRVGEDGLRTALAPPARESVPPPPTKTTHFTTVSEDELRKADQTTDSDDHSLASWLKLIAMAAVLAAMIGGGIWYTTRPPRADQLYASIQQVAGDGDPQKLPAIEADIGRFLELFPTDDRCPEMRQYQEDIELLRLQKRLEFRSRRGGAIGLLPLERMYVEALSHVSVDVEVAQAKFQAIVDLFAGEAPLQATAEQRLTHRQLVDLAKKQIARLEAENAAASQSQRELILDRLQAGQKLIESDPKRAEQILKGIVELYGAKKWAADLVQEAKDSLATVANPG